MPLQQPLLKILADGHFHSGEALGAQLGVSRAAIWKSLQAVQQWGIDIHSVRGRGYRLVRPVELLERERILSHLNAPARALCSDLEVHFELDSTNQHVMQGAELGLKSGHVVLAETQRLGRGRRGRPWLSPFGGNIYLSLLWRFDEGPARLAGLSLAVGIAVARSLSALDITGHGLKWPNDVLWQGRKLAGILLEVAGESTGPCHAVIGVGMNVYMPPAAGQAIDQPWTDIRSIKPGISRNRLAAELIQQILLALDMFRRQGLAPLVSEWSRWDVMQDRPVVLHFTDRKITGTARGVDEQGMLCLEVGGEVRRYGSGEVTLRSLE